MIVNKRIDLLRFQMNMGYHVEKILIYHKLQFCSQTTSQNTRYLHELVVSDCFIVILDVSQGNDEALYYASLCHHLYEREGVVISH